MSNVRKYLGAIVICKIPKKGKFKVVGVQTNFYSGKVTHVRLKDGKDSFYTEIKNITLLNDEE